MCPATGHSQSSMRSTDRAGSLGPTTWPPSARGSGLRQARETRSPPGPRARRRAGQRTALRPARAREVRAARCGPDRRPTRAAPARRGHAVAVKVPAAPSRTARKPAAVRRVEIIDAATVEFAETGLAGTGLESIAARAGISHPRVVFGSKRALFLAVVEANFDRLEAVFRRGRAGRSTLRAEHTGRRVSAVAAARPVGCAADAPGLRGCRRRRRARGRQPALPGAATDRRQAHRVRTRSRCARSSRPGWSSRSRPR